MGARWKGDLTLKFVQLYKQHQCLWNPNHVDFRNRHARCLSLAAIEEEIGPHHFMHVPIQKKIKNLKNTYVQEKKKIIEITSKGYSYEPQVRWFHEFHECMLQSGADGLSLERELKNETSYADYNQHNSMQDDTEASLDGDTDQVTDSVNKETVFQTLYVQAAENIIEVPPVKKRKHSKKLENPLTKSDNTLETFENALNNSDNMLETNEDHRDEFQLFANAMAAQLRKLPLETALRMQHKYEALVGGSGPLESALHLRLAEHLNSEVALGTVQDVSQCVQWVRSTFFHVRAASDPRKYLSLPANAPHQQITKKIEELCVIAMNRLATSGLITMDEASCIQPTEAGKLMSMYYLDFETMKLIMKVKGDESLEDILNLVCESHELSEMHLRVDERRCLNMLNRNNAGGTIRFPMKGKISNRHMKVNCIIQAILGCLPIPDPSLNQESVKIMRTADRVCKCLVAYITRDDFIAEGPNYFTAILSSIIFGKCMVAHLWEDSKFVSRQLKGIGPALSNLLASAGKTTFMLLEESHPRDIERILNKGPPNGNIIRKQVSLLPKYQLQADLVDTRTAVVKVVLLNHAFLENNVDNLTAGENHKAHVIVGDAANHILMCKLFKDKDLIGMYNGEIQYTVERILEDEHVISIQCISASFVGIDVALTFTFPGISSSTNSALLLPTTYLIPKKQATITDTFKIKKRKAEPDSDDKKMCKKQKDCSVIEKLKSFKDSFVTTKREIKQDRCDTDNTLNDENFNQFYDTPNLDCTVYTSENFDNNKVIPGKNYTLVKNNPAEKEQDLLKLDSGDIKDGDIENLLQEIEKEIHSTANMNSEQSQYNGSHCNDNEKYRQCQTKFAKQKLKSQNQSKMSLITDPYKSFSLNRPQHDNDEHEQCRIKSNTFALNIKDNLSKYLSDTKYKAETNRISSTIVPDLLLNMEAEPSFSENQEENIDTDASVITRKCTGDADDNLESTQKYATITEHYDLIEKASEIPDLQNKKDNSKSTPMEDNILNKNFFELKHQSLSSNDVTPKLMSEDNLKNINIINAKSECKQIKSNVESISSPCKRNNTTLEHISMANNNSNEVLLQINNLERGDDINKKSTKTTTLTKRDNQEDSKKVESTYSPSKTNKNRRDVSNAKFEVLTIEDQSSLDSNPETTKNISGLDHPINFNNSANYQSMNVVKSLAKTESETLACETIYGLDRKIAASSHCNFKVKLIKKIRMEVEIEGIITNETFDNNAKYITIQSMNRSLSSQQKGILKKVNSIQQLCTEEKHSHCKKDNIQNEISNPVGSSKKQFEYNSNRNDNLESHAVNNSCEQYQPSKPRSDNFIRNKIEFEQNSYEDTKNKEPSDSNRDNREKQTSYRITSNEKEGIHLMAKDKTKTVHTILSKYRNNKRSREAVDELQPVLLKTRSDQCPTSSTPPFKRPFHIKDINIELSNISTSQHSQHEVKTPLLKTVTETSPSTQLLTSCPNSVRRMTKEMNPQPDQSEKENFDQILTPSLEYADNRNLVEDQSNGISNLSKYCQYKNQRECSQTHSQGKPSSFIMEPNDKEQNLASKSTLETTYEHDDVINNCIRESQSTPTKISFMQEINASPSNDIEFRNLFDMHESIETQKELTDRSFYEPIFCINQNTERSIEKPRINSFLETSMREHIGYHESPQKRDFSIDPKFSHSAQGYSNTEYDEAHHTASVVNEKPHEIRQVALSGDSIIDKVLIKNSQHTSNREPFLIDNESANIPCPGITMTKKETWLLHPDTTIASKRLNHFPFQSETVVRNEKDAKTKLLNYRFAEKKKMRR